MSTPRKKTPMYSIILPVFNEEATLDELYSRLAKVLTMLDGPAEVVMVDDGSRDRSYEKMRAIHEKDPRFRIVHFSRNFGHQIAISAGMDYSQGQAVIIIDSDLQDPPELIPRLVERWREGYEIVYALRKERKQDSWLKRTTAAMFYRLLQRITEIEIPVDVGDFRLVDRKAVDAFKQLPERNRYVRGMFSWVGFRQTAVSFRREARHAGETKYSTKKMLRLALDGIFGFSKFPMRFALKLGLVTSALSLSCGAGLFLSKVAMGAPVLPWYILATLVTFLAGTQLLFLGIMGEYVHRALDEVRDRPLYVVAASHGFGEGSARRKAA